VECDGEVGDGEVGNGEVVGRIAIRRPCGLHLPGYQIYRKSSPYEVAGEKNF